jgi:uncharacterized membrane protein
MTMLQIALLALLAMLAGAVAGGVTAHWLLRRHPGQVQAQPAAFTDSALSTEIERAAGVWADAQGRPEAAGIVADKLRLLHRLGNRKGWWQ